MSFGVVESVCVVREKEESGHMSNLEEHIKASPLINPLHYDVLDFSSFHSMVVYCGTTMLCVYSFSIPNIMPVFLYKRIQFLDLSNILVIQ